MKNRAIPDVSSLADPFTGILIILYSYPVILGGTSAGAPALAALYSMVHSRKFFNPVWYANQKNCKLLRPICLGNNIVIQDSIPFPVAQTTQYRCGPYYSCVTGLGTVDGIEFAKIVQEKCHKKDKCVSLLPSLPTGPGLATQWIQLVGGCAEGCFSHK